MPDEIKDQIDAMLNIGESTEEESDDLLNEEEEKKEETSEEKEEEKEENEEKEEEESEKESEEEEKEEKKEEEIKEEEKEYSKTSEEDELETLKKENEALRLRVNEASEKKTSEDETKTETKTETEVEVKVETVEEIDFLGEDIDFDELTRSPDIFNKLLNKVYKMGSDVSRQFQETTLKNIPDIVKSNVLVQATLKKKVDNFYVENEDLKPFKKVVAAVYEELAAENSDWDLDKIFEETEKETRNRLELHKEARKTDKSKKTEKEKEPRFPKTKSSRSRQKPNTSLLLEDIDKMNEVL